jgi:trehalose 6-phosphate phosphatase
MIDAAPTTSQGAEGLAALRATPGRSLVGLDFDGTLAPIVDDPAAARPAPGATRILAELAARVGAVAIVTGRPALVAVELLDLDDASDLIVLGHYGLERWTAKSGVVRAPDVSTEGVTTAREELADVLAGLRAPAGTAVEDKGESVAVHVRQAADPGAALALLRQPLSDLAHRHGLRLEPGRLVLELRPAGIDKGSALERLARELGAVAVLYAGDDLGDVAAFDAIDRLRANGVAGLTICSRSAEVTKLASRADLVLDGPPALVEYLSRLAAGLPAR